MNSNSKITAKATFAMVLLSVLQLGCATSSESSAGGVLGALAGAAIAAIDCSTSSGNKLHDCKEEIAAGAIIGGFAGYIAGTRLQDRREEGQSDLEFIQANNADMEKRNAELKKQNAQTRSLIVKTNAEIEQIRSSVASVGLKQEQINAVAAKAKADNEIVQAAKKDAEIELADQEKMLVAVQAGDFPESEEKKLEEQIASLRIQIDILDEGEQELASLSSTTI